MVSVRISREIMAEMKEAAKEKFMLSDPKPVNKDELTGQVLQAISEIPFYQKAVAYATDPVVVDALNNMKSTTIHARTADYLKTQIARSIHIDGLVDTANKPYRFTTTPKIPATMYFVSQYGNEFVLHIDMIPEPTRQTLKDAITQSLSEVHAWQERFDAFTSKTSEIFEACRTTAQLLNAWPAAEAFLPKEVVTKMQTKVVSQADLDAKAKREAFTSEGLDEHILIANIVAQTSGGGTQGSGTI